MDLIPIHPLSPGTSIEECATLAHRVANRLAGQVVCALCAVGIPGPYRAVNKIRQQEGSVVYAIQARRVANRLAGKVCVTQACREANRLARQIP